MRVQEAHALVHVRHHSLSSDVEQNTTGPAIGEPSMAKVIEAVRNSHGIQERVTD